MKLRAFALIFLVFILSACGDFKALVGIKDVALDIPSGEYIGTAKKISNANNAEDADPKASNPVLDPNAPVSEIKINFLPKAPDLDDGVGVLTMAENSQRFYWRNDGNNKNTWNVLFQKDQNVYTNIKEGFKFDGIMTASDIENKLTGRLVVTNEAEAIHYFIEAAQVFKPEIIPPKAALEVKAGEPIVLDVNKIGEDDDAVQVYIISLTPEAEATTETATPEAGTEASSATPNTPAPASSTEGSAEPLFKGKLTPIAKIERSEKGNKITLNTDKAAIKGDYSIYIVRSNKHKSNSIPMKIM